MGKHKTWGKSRSLRLKRFDYATRNRAYHVILGSFQKTEIFISEEVNVEVIRTLKEASERYGYDLVAYCLMPDHLHILVQAKGDCQDLKKLVASFKSYSNRQAGGKLWQRGFYEHVMRSDEILLKVAEYILNNPVRKGIVKGWEDYLWGELLL